MGERLVLTYTQESNPKINAISIYQHWSAYTDSAIETAEIINNWIEQFQDTTEFTAMTPHERFIAFVQAFSTGKIIDEALITDASLKIYDTLELEPLVYDATLLDRNSGLIDINNETETAVSWAQMTADFDTTEWFNDNPSRPDFDYLQFFNMETLTIKVNQTVDPLALPVKQVIANSNDIDNLEYVLAEFDADLDENDMPDDYNLSLKAYLAQNAHLPSKFYKTLADLEKAILEDNAFNFYHITTDYDSYVNEAVIEIYYARGT